MIELRDYQQNAVNACYDYLRSSDGNPCIVAPTGTGKSLIIAKITSDAATIWGGRVLILAHVKELLEQNAAKLQILAPHLDIGVYSAGLKRREGDNQVVVAGIQSVYKKAAELGRFDLVIVDEAHLIPPPSSSLDGGEGMYRSMLAELKLINPELRLIGLTATPYRLQGGLICSPENLLNEVCYEIGLKEMIQRGFLSPITARGTRDKADFASLHIRGGEFINSEVEHAMNVPTLVESNCAEIVERTRDRKSVLIFCAGVDHCREVAAKLAEISGEECAYLTGSTPASERAELIARFRGELSADDLMDAPRKPLKYLCNVGVLTTGFDAPNTDCVVMLKPTNSPGLLVQIAGRGLRLSPATGKTDCLFLDYGQNILRHGPLDMIQVKSGNTARTGKRPVAKECPECLAQIHAAYARCPHCGYEFPPNTRSGPDVDRVASGEEAISGVVSYQEYEVQSVRYEPHVKRGMENNPEVPRTVQVEYQLDLNNYKFEWLCPEHTGYARSKFEKWWSKYGALGCPAPDSVDEVIELANRGMIAKVLAIKVKHVSGERFDTVTELKCEARPVYVPEREPGADESADSDYAANSPADLGVKRDWADDGIPF